MELILKTHFDAAHRLKDYDGPCAELHGHRWEVEVIVSGEPDEKTGMIMDFKNLKQVVEEHLPDHKYINDWIEQPTAENIAMWLFSRIVKDVPQLESVTVWESPDAAARYSKN